MIETVRRNFGARVDRAQAPRPGPPDNRLIVRPETNTDAIINTLNSKPMWRLERVWEERAQRYTLVLNLFPL